MPNEFYATVCDYNGKQPKSLDACKLDSATSFASMTADVEPSFGFAPCLEQSYEQNNFLVGGGYHESCTVGKQFHEGSELEQRMSRADGVWAGKMNTQAPSCLNSEEVKFNNFNLNPEQAVDSQQQHIPESCAYEESLHSAGPPDKQTVQDSWNVGNPWRMNVPSYSDESDKQTRDTRTFSLATSCKVKCSSNMQKPDDHSLEGSVQSDIAVSCITSQNISIAEEQVREISERKAQVKCRDVLDTTSHQGQEASSEFISTEIQSIDIVEPSSTGMNAFESIPKSSTISFQNYNTFQRMAAVKTATSGSKRRYRKKSKDANLSFDASHINSTMVPDAVNGHKADVGFSVGSNHSGSCNSSISSMKMLSFSSKESEARSAGTSSQFVSGKKKRPSRNLRAFSKQEEQCLNHYQDLCSSASEGGQIRGKIRSRKHVGANVSKNEKNIVALGGRICTRQPAFLGQKPSFTGLLQNQSLSCYQLLPWHQEITEGSRSLKAIRMAEQDWAQSTKRKIDMVETEAQMMDGFQVPRSKRRLILTTQLMQQIFSPLPPALLKTDAALISENVIYWISRLELRDACALLGYTAMGGADMLSEKFRISYNAAGHFSKAMGDYVGRQRLLEREFLRLNGRTSVRDVRLECQKLSGFCIVNRFGKFHGRNQSRSVKNSPLGDISSEMLPQVSALALPGEIPKGVRYICL